jgi:hypothetical protein
MTYVMKDYKIPENSVDLWISTDPHLPRYILKKASSCNMFRA